MPEQVRARWVHSGALLQRAGACTHTRECADRRHTTRAPQLAAWAAHTRGGYNEVWLPESGHNLLDDTPDVLIEALGIALMEDAAAAAAAATCPAGFASTDATALDREQESL